MSLSGAAYADLLTQIIQQNAAILVAIAVLAATYLFLKRIQRTGQCPFAGFSSSGGARSKAAAAGTQQVRVLRVCLACVCVLQHSVTHTGE